MKPLTYKLYSQAGNADLRNVAEYNDKYWDSGLGAAGCIFVAKDTGRILLSHRSDSVNEPNTWGTWGGKIDESETPAQAVIREIEEETGYDGRYKLSPLWTFKDHEAGFKYHNYLAIIEFEFTPKLNWETDNSEWVEWGEWPSPMHFGLQSLLQHAGDTIHKVVTLIKRKKADVLDENSAHFNSESFRRWFGNSVVKSKDGTPIRVYHGTNQPISAFSRDRRGSSTNASSAKKAFFFTDNPEVAGTYAAHAGRVLRSDVASYEQKVNQFQLKLDALQRVAYRTGDWTQYEKVMDEYEEFDLNGTQEGDIPGQNIIPVYLRIENPAIYDFKGEKRGIGLGGINDLVELALKNKNDGVIMKNLVDPEPASTHYVVFHPNQIKSATGNNGKYNPRRADITTEVMDVPPPPAIVQKATVHAPDVINVTNAYVVAATLWGEAANQGETGMQAVMNVIMNRAGGDFSKAVNVVLSPKQFSTWNDVNDPVAKSLQNANIWREDKDFQKCFHIVSLASKGNLPDITGGAQFYFNPRKAKPDWASKMQHTKTIGSHEFYKVPPKKVKHPIHKKIPTSIREMIENQNPDDAVSFRGPLVGDGVWKYELRSPFSVIKYRYAPKQKLFYLDNIATPNVQNRGQGYATAILKTFFTLIKQHNGMLDCDTYTTAGMEQIKPVIERFAAKFGVRIVRGKDEDDVDKSEKSGMMNEGERLDLLNQTITALEAEWDRLDSQGSGFERQQEIQKQLVKCRHERENWEKIYRAIKKP
jgi:8-oxo-dGTP pyrophosphatase MutT (NUDIX family)/spore germination cell wall hydrolase CwlJ-like protein